jgi:hypothetical protein
MHVFFFNKNTFFYRKNQFLIKTFIMNYKVSLNKKSCLNILYAIEEKKKN